MTSSEPRPVRPIGRVRIGTPMLLGITLAVTVPVTVAYGAAGGFDRLADRQKPGLVALAGPITAVQVTGLNEDLQITGSPDAGGVTGSSLISYHETATMPHLEESVVDGVAKLAFTCPIGNCDGGVAWHLSVPAGVPVTATTSNATVWLDSLGGTVNVTSSNGDIRAQRLGSGDAVFRTQNGVITAQFDGAPMSVSATTENERVDITTDGTTPAYDDVSAENGELRLTNPGARDRFATHVIKVTTTNDSVTIR